MSLFRGQYRLSDKVVVGYAQNKPAGFFDDAEHGTTIEFDQPLLPASLEKIYDDTPSAEKLDPNSNYQTYLGLTTDAVDTDGDGIPDIAADDVATATITIQKRDSADAAMTDAGDNEDFVASASGGSLDMASGALVNGTKQIVLQASTAVGSIATILLQEKDPNTGLGRRSIRIKFR